MNVANKQMPARKFIQERQRTSMDGYLMITIGLGLILGAIYLMITLIGSTIGEPSVGAVLLRVGMIILGIFSLSGIYMLQPNEAALLSLFGQYKGTDRSEGLRWANPFFAIRKLSLRHAP